MPTSARRFLPVVIVVLIAVAAFAWFQLGRKAPGSPPSDTGRPAPLAKQPEYLKTADRFMAAWAKGDAPAVYALLSDRMKQLISEPEFAKQMAEVKVANPRVAGHATLTDTAYVVERVDAPQPAGASPVDGYSILLQKISGEWKVALFIAEEKVPQKYGDLRIARGKDKGYVVTYQDEKGQVATVNLETL